MSDTGAHYKWLREVQVLNDVTVVVVVQVPNDNEPCLPLYRNFFCIPDMLDEVKHDL